ncbi:MAG: hypothetical protein K5790_10215 [Nitrosopumilus sp.]|uniref:hypothetical protein n=1 Tax=Nitrosopumilus sp. TaxID=2024843 RepID=UPI00247EFD94|nr:hypothetical protein [Nitrosopumilus sp.]MCV0393643.1 hypothetical protein [Nitrosopumilus sp.]
MVTIKSIELEFQSHHILYVIVFIGISILLFGMYQSFSTDPATGIGIMDFTEIERLWGDMEQKITVEFEKFTEHPFFKQAGTVITFFYSMTPSFIPIPNELFMTPLVLAEPTQEQQFNQAIFLILLTSTGGFIGDALMFSLAKRHVHKLVRRDKADELENNHWFHRFGVLMFLFTPSLWFAGGGAEVALVLAGYAQMDEKKLFPFLFAGNLIRGIWGGIIFLSFLGLL